MSGTESGTAKSASWRDSADAERLLELAAKCEQATGADRELDRDIYEALGAVRPGTCDLYWQAPDGQTRHYEALVPPYTASLDAALTLLPEGLCWALGVNRNPKAKLIGGSAVAILRDDFGTDISRACAATPAPALALCAAALRARANSGEIDHG